MTVALRTRESLENAIIDWIAAVHPIGRRILGWPNAPRPALPYVSARITAIQRVGQDDRTAPDSEGVQTIYGDRLMTVTVNGFGAGALDMVEALASSIWKSSVSSALLANGLCPQLPGPVNDLTQMLETSAEERAHCDFVFGFKQTYQDTPGLIEHVAGDGVVLDEEETEITVSFAADLE